MNKKIKLSLLGVLFAGSALAITLPIVSCSSSATTLTVTKTPGASDANLNALGLAITRIANSTASSNTTQTVTSANFTTITGTTNGYTVAAIKTAVDAVFGFQNGTTDVADADAIESVAFSGTFPNGTSAAVNVTVTVTLKSGFTAAAADLQQVVRIGTTPATA